MNSIKCLTHALCLTQFEFDIMIQLYNCFVYIFVYVIAPASHRHVHHTSRCQYDLIYVLVFSEFQGDDNVVVVAVFIFNLVFIEV